MAQFELIQGSDRWKRLRKKCIENLYFFNAKILGLEDKIPMTPAAHYGLCRFAERKTGIPEIDNSRIQLIQIWRGAGKSALVTFGRTVQQICANRNISIGIANERQENANAFLATIKQTFETNELLQILFPEVIPDFNKTTWKSDRIVVNRTVPNPVNPTVLAAGAGATVTGVHLNQWIVDDIISQDAAENARAGSFTEIDKANRWIDRLEPLLDRMGHDPISFIGCIGQHEPVLMADGSWKSIKDIQVGDEVWACKKDGSEGFKARTVTGVWPQGKSEVLELYAAGRTMICTKDHPILTAAGRADGVGRTWTEAGDIKGKVEIFEKTPADLWSRNFGEEEVYDLTIEDGDCAFVVNGFIVGNTPWWIDDCYSYVEKLYTNDEPLRKFTWSLNLPDDRIQRIVLEQAGDLAIFRHYPIDQETGRAVWPEKLPLDKLEAERKRKPVFFAAQYLLQPGAGDASFFDEKWLEERTFEWEGPKQIRWKDTDKKIHFERINELGIIMSVDPAISKKREADNSAIMITGSNGTQTFLLEAWGKRVGATELAHQILEFYVRYKPERIIVETVAYQEALLEILELLRSEHGIHHRLPIFDYKTGSDDKKRVRILGLEPYFRKGLVYVHPASQQDFLNEFRNYPHTKHDDLLDALSMQRSSWERLHSGLGGREESQFGQKWRLRQQEIAAKHRNRRRNRR